MAEQIAEFMTVRELADLLKVAQATIYRGVDAGEIPHRRIGRSIRFHRQDVDEYLARVRVAVEAK